MDLRGSRFLLSLLFPGAMSPGAGAGELPEVMAPLPAGASAMETRYNSEFAPTSGLSRAQAYLLARTVADTAGRDLLVSAVAPTGSMKPFFNDNALLLLEAVPFDELQIGDVVTYFHAERKRTLVHRLVEKRGDRFWARGDHNRRMDDIYVTRENYQRRLAGVIYMRPDNDTKAGETVMLAKKVD
jgi:signal peptidase I